jgi:peptidoglycan hydrolase-like protein with peptidoglycan-binding domain
MNKIMNLGKLQKNTYQQLILLSVVTTVAMLAVLLLGIQSASAAITSQLDFGDRGSEVTELQTYLSTSPSIYPSGLVTGYFGSLTQAGVQRFQVAQGIVSQGMPATTGYGRVGPLTMARINSLLGFGGQTFFDASPILSNPVVESGDTTATFAWSTNEPTQGQVYWNSSPLQFNEAIGPKQQPFVSGTVALDTGGLQTSHMVTISNLQPDTTYYYLVRSVDSTGNMSMVWPKTFRTED